MSVRNTYLVVLTCVALLVVPRTVDASQPSTPARDTGEARLLFVGDVMLGRYVGSSMAAYGTDPPFAGVKDFLSSADLTIGNLEGPVVPTNRFAIPRPYPNLLNLTGSDRAAPSLSKAGFDLLSLANNHSYDSRFEGLKSTMDALQGTGIAPFGVDSPTGQPAVVREVHGLKIAFLAYTSILNIWLAPVAGLPFISFVNPNVPGDRERLAREVAKAKQSADLVVLVMHWGAEYTLQPVAGQKLLAQTAAAAGADLIVGAHPHVAQGMEQLRNGNRSTLVAYSLGNALFDQMARLDTRQGLALECVVDRDGVKRARLIPLEIRSNRQGFYMNVVDDASGQTALNRAAASTPNEMKWKALWDAAHPQPGLALAYRRPISANQSSDEVLGMSAPTRVELRGGTLLISTKDASGSRKTVWQSDPGWRVTGYAVGDADADGRSELVYSLWKRGLVSTRPPGGGMNVERNGGAVLPHIYINGWRENEMRPVWHGSPRPAPALALGVAPIGMNRKPLLAVLESSDPAVEKAPGRVRLWEWTGNFGYELVKDLPGTYSEMWSDGRVVLVR